jgi:uncharacterized alpha-E superfamily protein
MLSRVANSVYWLGRYLERSENYSRFIDVNFNLMADLPPDVKEQWEPLIRATGDYSLYINNYDNFNREDAIYFLAFDENNPNSLVMSVSRARENARVVRENLTKESWEKLNEIYLFVKEGADKQLWKKEDCSQFFKDVKYGIQLLYGIAENSVARTDPWYFIRLGQYLERADKTSRILDVKYHILLPSVEEVGSQLDFLHWTALLKSVSGYNFYRRFYGKIEPVNIVELLVLNKYFPRSVFFCLTHAENCLRTLSGTTEKGYTNTAEKALGALQSRLEYQDVNEVISSGLHEYLDALQVKINNISDAIHDNFFKLIPNSMNQHNLQE